MLLGSIFMMLAALWQCVPAAYAAANGPERVIFRSGDGKTDLVGYLFKAANAVPRAPAVVMMHGRAGAYSTAAKGVYNASTLLRRHRAWGKLWAERGYVALLVDGFGPRGFPQGFPRFSYESRPEELNEVTVRPLDAYGALNYLRSRSDVLPSSIGLQGWSNGGSAALATMAVNAAGVVQPTPTSGFRAAVVFYPACGLKGQFDDGYRPYAPVRVFHGTADEEVSPARCSKLVERSRLLGGDVEIHLYPGATHSFDDPGRRRQSLDANAPAIADAVERSTAFFEQELERRSEK
jgi:dienelactone hydrolase